jgi:hypothetical protein
MKITYQLSNEDIIALNVSYLEQSPDMNRIIRRSTFVTPVFLVLIGFGISHLFKKDLIVTIPFAIGLGVLYYFYYPKWRKSKIIKSAVKNSQNVVGQNSLELKEEYVIINQPDSETKVEWRSLLKVDETKEHLFIYIKEGSVFIVPLTQINAFEKSELINFLSVKKDILLNVL